MASSSMSKAPAKTCEGVFAIRKPPDISSAQVIRDVQSHFNSSALFKPWFDEERARRDAESDRQRGRRKSWKQRQPLQLKMGHGGTLDPMATGVLILGIGSGTKQLSRFLECTKSYEAVVLFGAATDSYDAVGKIVARKEYGHITREMVERALDDFKGRIMQRPPIFSALRVQGKRLYEYAREGKEVPVEIEPRQMHVEQMEMLEWMEGGTHAWKWPTEMATTPEREMAGKMLDLRSHTESERADSDAKRKRSDEEKDADNHAHEEPEALPKRARTAGSPDLTGDGTSKQEVSSTGSPADLSAATSSPCLAPACRLRMTVTSGFYVRSLCHDLGAAVGSLALMSSLVRTRQGDFELDKNVLEYDDLEKGDDVWEPKVKGMLEAWQTTECAAGSHSLAKSPPMQGRRASPPSSKQRSNKAAKQGMEESTRRRNSSSDDA